MAVQELPGRLTDLAASVPQAPAAVEKPSGKGAGDENFPVGSRLIRRAMRPHVMAFYAFARAADDIADDTDLSPDEKLRRLDLFEAALTGQTGPAPGLEKPVRLRESLRQCGVTDRHARDLLSAFRQDAVKHRYADFGELLDYCERSANPVGRYLLDLHGEDPAGYPASDALCTALQIINHMQDCAKDRRGMDRVYLAADWLAEDGGRVEDLDGAAASAGLLATIRRHVAATEALLDRADTLTGHLKDRGLRLESTVILVLARAINARLARRDPVAERVALGKFEAAMVLLKGIIGRSFGFRR